LIDKSQKSAHYEALTFKSNYNRPCRSDSKFFELAAPPGDRQIYAINDGESQIVVRLLARNSSFLLDTYVVCKELSQRSGLRNRPNTNKIASNRNRDVMKPVKQYSRFDLKFLFTIFNTCF